MKSNKIIYYLAILIFFANISAAYFLKVYFERKYLNSRVSFYMQAVEIMHKRQARNMPNNAILFFGDSHIQGLAVTAITPNAMNFGIGHLRLEYLSNNLHTYPNLNRAETIIIAAGINDVLNNSLDNDEIDDLLVKIKSNLNNDGQRVVIFGLLPINEVKMNKKGVNEIIIKFNEKLANKSSELGFIYLDHYNIFSDSNGQLNERYDLGDGLHLSVAGYDTLIELIKLSMKKWN